MTNLFSRLLQISSSGFLGKQVVRYLWKVQRQRLTIQIFQDSCGPQSTHPLTALGLNVSPHARPNRFQLGHSLQIGSQQHAITSQRHPPRWLTISVPPGLPDPSLHNYFPFWSEKPLISFGAPPKDGIRWLGGSDRSWRREFQNHTWPGWVSWSYVHGCSHFRTLRNRLSSFHAKSL